MAAAGAFSLAKVSKRLTQGERLHCPGDSALRHSIFDIRNSAVRCYLNSEPVNGYHENT
jgi:hypothetical protein